MKKLEMFFPLSRLVQPGIVQSVVMVVLFYLVGCGLFGLLEKLLGWIPLAGAIATAILSLGGIYCVVGIVLAIWRFVRET